MALTQIVLHVLGLNTKIPGTNMNVDRRVSHHQRLELLVKRHDDSRRSTSV